MRNKLFLCLCVLICQLILVPRILANDAGRPADAGQRVSAPMLIERDRANGSISIDQWALYHAYAFKDPGQLPLKYRSGVPEKCGTWILDEIHRSWNTLSLTTRNALVSLGWRRDGVLSRPTGLDSTRSTTHFLYHFSLTPGDTNAVPALDADANGTPDYIDTVMTTMEYVWNYETSTMGYVPPPPDGSDGGNALYDVYIFDLDAGDYGYADPENDIGDNPNSTSVTETNAFTSYLALRNDYKGFASTGAAAIEVTAAHEFFHSIQNGYDTDVPVWMKEATATWCEDEVYDLINDNYQYLPLIFSTPWIPLDAGTRTADTVYSFAHKYGSWIFFRYLSEHVGGRPIIRRIWERVIVYDNTSADHSFDEIGDALAERGTTFIRAFREFTAANLTTTILPYRYREGANYPRAVRYVFANDTTINSGLDRHSCHFFQIPAGMLPTCANLLTVTFTPKDSIARLGADLVSCSKGYATLIPFQSKITLPGDVTPDSLFVVVLNFDFPRVTGGYKLQVQTQLRSSQYTLTDLGKIGANGTVNSINNLGHVVGTLYTLSGGVSYITPVKWINGSMSYLGSDGSTSDINNNDEIAGTVRTPYGAHAYYWGPAETVSMDTVVRGYSSGKAINDSGYAVGSAFFALNGGTETNAQPFIWKNNQMTKLPIFTGPNAVGGTAYDINNQNQILGVITAYDTAAPFSAREHSALWTGGGGVPQDLGTDFLPLHLNDEGVLIGNGSVDVTFDGISSSLVHAMSGSGGGRVDLGTIDNIVGNSSPMGINNKGDIVGGSGSALGAHAFLYSNGGMRDLNTLLPFGACWSLQSATAINDSGQIVGIGFPAADGLTHAFMLTPAVPTGVRENAPIPSAFQLYQNYPNPFNPATEIKYQIPKYTFTTLKVYDLLGREVATLVNELKQPGTYSIRWNAGSFASGVYYCRIEAGEFTDVKKLILLK